MKNPANQIKIFSAKVKAFYNPERAVKMTVALLIGVSIFIFYSSLKIDQSQNLLNRTLSEKEQLIASLSTRVKNLLAENATIRGEDTYSQLTTVNNTIEKYETIKAKTADYKTQGVNVATTESQLPTVIDLILQKKYSDADTLLTKLDGDLEIALKDKRAADAAAAAAKKVNPPPVATCGSLPSNGYCRLSVAASSGTFTVDVAAASVSSVWTYTANSDNCADQCPTKSLVNYISGNGGFAGMNGTYFCPPDYASCAGKVSSYDFPVYNSNLHKWLNEDKMLWSNRAMLAFTGGGAVFYPQANAYTGLGGIKAGIVNYPGLVQNGANIVGNYSLTSAQYTKGNRGGIAVKGSSVYLIIAKSASVPDLANIMVALGMTSALNLDGGGSSALYSSGSYKVGPGRSLPNAVILK